MIECPTHGEQLAVPALAPEDARNGFTVCRRCWYREWLIACLTYWKETVVLKLPTWLFVAIIVTLTILAWVVFHG